MAKKATAKSSAKPTKKAAAKSGPAIPGFEELSEDQLRDLAREDMEAVQRGEGDDVEMMDVEFKQDTHVRELGRTVRAGETETLPVSVVGYYNRKDPKTFGTVTETVTGEPLAPGVDGQQTNQHNPEGSVSN